MVVRALPPVRCAHSGLVQVAAECASELRSNSRLFMTFMAVGIYEEPDRNACHGACVSDACMRPPA